MTHNCPGAAKREQKTPMHLKYGGVLVGTKGKKQLLKKKKITIICHVSPMMAVNLILKQTGCFGVTQDLE